MDDGAGLPTNGGVQFTWMMGLDYPQMEECSSHGRWGWTTHKWRSAVHMDDGAGLPTNGGVQFTWMMGLDYPQMEECSSHG